MSEHVGRSWTGRPLEDACPCPQEPCGLVAVARIDPACGQHALAAGKTIRQSHTPERCTVTAPTSPKPRTPADPNDLRTDLTKLADKWLSNKDRPSDYQDGVADAACAIRALLAAHPAPETVGHVCTPHCDAERGHYPAPVSDTRREDVIDRVRATLGRTSESDEEVVDAVLAVLPAPPVEHLTFGGERCVYCGANYLDAAECEVADPGERRAQFMRALGEFREAAAPPVVDEGIAAVLRAGTEIQAQAEAEVRERIARDIEDLPSRSVTGVPHYAAYIRDEAARIARGATR